MGGFIEPVTRKETHRFGKASHHYVDGNKTRIPGVTTILGDGLPKPALVGWAGKVTAEYAVDHWDELGEMNMSERLDKLKKCRYEIRDAAANRGTEVHKIGEHLVVGDEVTVPDELAGHVEAYVKFLDDWDVQPVVVEAVVYHLGHGWAGTLDLIADLNDGSRWLLDIKTAKGVYGDNAFQLAAYRHAEHMWNGGEDSTPMIPVDRVGVIHVRSDGYDLVPLRADEVVYNQFRHIATVARAAKTADSYILPALNPEKATA